MNPKNFFIEFMQRLVKENPKFFKPFTYLFTALLCFSGLVELLGDFQVVLPAWVAVVNTKVLAAISFIGLLFSRLPNKDLNEQK